MKPAPRLVRLAFVMLLGWTLATRVHGGIVSHPQTRPLKDIVSSNATGLNLGYRDNEANRLKFVDDTSTGLPTRTTGYTYNANGSLATATAPNGAAHTYTYDTLNPPARPHALPKGHASSARNSVERRRAPYRTA